jgi:proteasome lid subunit RPN8/RPN11
MTEPEPTRPSARPVHSSDDEPAVLGDALVPDVPSWQHAADQGAARSAAASAGPAVTAAPVSPATIPDAVRQDVVDWLRGALPNEGCGLLVAERIAREGGVPTRFVGMRNAAASPYRYLMDPQEQLRVLLEIDDADEVVWAIVHSHVASPARPSSTDVGLAAYPDALYVVCSFASDPPDLRAWTIVAGAVDEVALETA